MNTEERMELRETVWPITEGAARTLFGYNYDCVNEGCWCVHYRRGDIVRLAGRYYQLEPDPTPQAQKHDAGKLPLWEGLLQYFPQALEQVAHVSGGGKDKYGHWGGWRAVPNAVERYSGAMARHVVDAAKGFTFSDDPALRPKTRVLAQVAWNALAVLQLQLDEEARLGLDLSPPMPDKK